MNDPPAPAAGIQLWHPLPKLLAQVAIVLRKSEKGHSISCSDLPGCWSQGETEEAALVNIRDAVQEYLEGLALARAIAEGEDTEIINRDEVFKSLR